MAKLFLLLIMIFIASCGPMDEGYSVRLRDPKTGAVLIQSINVNYHIGDTVIIADKVYVIVDSVKQSQ